MKIKPIYDRIIVEPIQDAETTSSGIWVGTSTTTPILRARVIACGHGRLQPNGTVIPLLVHPGDVVHFQRSQGIELPIEDTNQWMVQESSILVVETV